MSLKHEQYRALLITRDFLRDIIDPRKRPQTAKELTARALQCLRHYPFLDANGEPMFSQDDFAMSENRKGSSK